MARGKHRSLEEARKDGQLKQFAKEHPATGDRERFDKLFGAMTAPPEPKPRKKAPPK